MKKVNTHPIATRFDFRKLADIFDNTSALAGRHLTPHADLNTRHTFGARRQLRGHRHVSTGFLAHRGVLLAQLEGRVLFALLADELTHRAGTLFVCFVVHFVLLDEGHIGQAATARQRKRVCVDHMNLHAGFDTVKTQHTVVVSHLADGLAVGFQNKALVIHVCADVSSELLLDIANLQDYKKNQNVCELSELCSRIQVQGEQTANAEQKLPCCGGPGECRRDSPECWNV